MIETTYIKYANTEIEVPRFLSTRWPFNLPLSDWPSFCGAGDGLGDRIVPDTINGNRVACCCFEHDISWILADATFAAFMKSNLRLYLNLRAVVIANDRPGWWRHMVGERKCFAYFLAVCTFGRKCFKSSPYDCDVYENPLDNPAIKDKLKKLYQDMAVDELKEDK